jgi:N-formylglutamate amidohydrolase
MTRQRAARRIGAGFPPSRRAPPPAVVPVSTGGLYPRDYRRRLRDGERVAAVSEFDSTTAVCDAPTPLIGTAIHYAGEVRRDIRDKTALDRAKMYHEEDPETHRFLGPLAHTLTPNQSRFEFDLNRPPDTAIYSKPSLAWGLDVWKTPLGQFEREFSLEKWYEFHTMVDCAVEDAVERFGFAVVFDFHSYNYQRAGPTDWRGDGKPVINLGTRHLQPDDKGRDTLDWFLREVRGHTVGGEPCLVEENGVFYGGYLNRRLSHLYGPKVLTLSIEYKKVYMDEATGALHDDILNGLVAQMDETIRALADRLGAPVREKSALPFLDVCDARDKPDNVGADA